MRRRGPCAAPAPGVAIARSRWRRWFTGITASADRSSQLGDLVGAEHDAPGADRHDDVVVGGNDGVESGGGEHLEHRRRALAGGRVGVVDGADRHLRHAQVGDRALAHAALTQRRQHVGDVVEERPVGTDDEDAVACETPAVLEDEIGGTVQRHRRLARARPALHDEDLVDRRADDDVLFGLDRRHDLAHRAGAFGADLGEDRVGDPTGDVGGVGVVEVLVEVRGDLAASRA